VDQNRAKEERNVSKQATELRYAVRFRVKGKAPLGEDEMARMTKKRKS
jgi:hypothetical protein